jgi:hypothetical protein
MSNHHFNVSTLRRFGVIGLAMLTLATTSLANDSDRITQLESEVQQLKQRLNNLEKPNGAAITSSKPLASTDGWKNLANWRSVKKGMSQDEVRSVLGEPATVRASGPIIEWIYSNRGNVTFYQERLDGWMEPR